MNNYTSMLKGYKTGYTRSTKMFTVESPDGQEVVTLNLEQAFELAKFVAALFCSSTEVEMALRKELCVEFAELSPFYSNDAPIFVGPDAQIVEE
jgi:hypothetical protein